jgi:hypothetical protein
MATASAASHDLVWMRHFMVELGLWDSKYRAVLFGDNDSAVGINNDRVGLTYRNRWMRTDDIHFRDFQRVVDLLIKRIDTKVNPADHFTKPIGPIKLIEACGTMTGNATEFPAELHRALFHTKQSEDPLPDTPISQMERNAPPREADTSE